MISPLCFFHVFMHFLLYFSFPSVPFCQLANTTPFFYPAARLVLESDNLTGRLKIRSEKTNRYLCMNKKGELVARVRKSFF